MKESPLRDLARQLRATARAHMAYSQVVVNSNKQFRSEVIDGRQLIWIVPKQ